MGQPWDSNEPAIHGSCLANNAGILGWGTPLWSMLVAKWLNGSNFMGDDYASHWRLLTVMQEKHIPDLPFTSQKWPFYLFFRMLSPNEKLRMQTWSKSMAGFTNLDGSQKGHIKRNSLSKCHETWLFSAVSAVASLVSATRNLSFVSDQSRGCFHPVHPVIRIKWNAEQSGWSLDHSHSGSWLL